MDFIEIDKKRPAVIKASDVNDRYLEPLLNTAEDHSYITVLRYPFNIFLNEKYINCYADLNNLQAFD